MRKKTGCWSEDMKEKELLANELDAVYGRWRRINAWIDRLLLSILLFLAVFAGSGLIDGLLVLEEGINTVRYHSFQQLLDINPDTLAWLTMDGTRIDHPVVRSHDNFDYLDRSFDGRDYAGGTLFMDKDNRGFDDPYCIIHGHHMAGGAMFGDLPKYLEKDFFEENRTGKLLTPEYDYDVKVLAAGIFDAYDRSIYRVGGTVPYAYMKEKAITICRDAEPSHVVALSTCLDDMSDNRVVVFCGLINRRAHE